jgi:hypothetical protein
MGHGIDARYSLYLEAILPFVNVARLQKVSACVLKRYRLGLLVRPFYELFFCNCVYFRTFAIILHRFLLASV